MYMYTDICMHIRKHISVYVCMCMCVPTATPRILHHYTMLGPQPLIIPGKTPNAYVCMHTYIHVLYTFTVFVYVFACLFMYVCTYIHVHTYIWLKVFSSHIMHVFAF